MPTGLAVGRGAVVKAAGPELGRSVPSSVGCDGGVVTVGIPARASAEGMVPHAVYVCVWEVEVGNHYHLCVGGGGGLAPTVGTRYP